MFRQVVAYRWVEHLSDDAKAAFRASLASLRAIPELTSVRFADDARYFEGNFDVVAVMDYPDFAAARRYVADDRHQAYVREFASQMIGERVVVQHDWAVGDLAGIHHITLPVSDVDHSASWYETAFGFATASASGDANDHGVTLVHPEVGTTVVLRHDPPRAAALEGFDVLTFAVGTLDDLHALVARLDEQHIGHGAPTALAAGVTVDVRDPDGMVVRVSTLLP